MSLFKPASFVAGVVAILSFTPGVSYRASAQESNGVLRQVYLNVPGGTIGDLTSHSSFPNSPSLETVEQVFEAPQNIAENYGQRMRALVVAPATGNYVFWIASDDNGALFLSTTESPAQKVQIASVNTWTGSRDWTREANQQSAPISLVAGQRYYIEALHKEGSGGDNLAVKWQLPNGTPEEPIPNNRLSLNFMAASPPDILSVTILGNSVKVAFTCGSGASCTVQKSSNGFSWINLTNTPVPVSGHYEVTDSTVELQKFYRIVDPSGPLYSLHVGGYLKISLVSGWNLIANPFLGNSRIQDLFTSLPAGSQIDKVGVSGFDCSLYDDFDGWYDCNTLGPSTITLSPGEGAFLRVNQSMTQIFSGIVPEGTLNNKLPAGFSLCSSIAPQSGGLQSTLNFPAQDGDVVYKFNSVGFEVYAFFDGFWDPVEPSIATGQAFWVNLPSVRNWARMFTFSSGGSPYTVTNRAYNGGDLVPNTVSPPSISVQPQSTSRLIGGNVTISVSASGTAPLSYQWFFGTNAVAGATSSNYTRLDLQGVDSGSFSVVVSNPYGSATSSIATLTVQAILVNGVLTSGSVSATNSAQIQITNAYANGVVFYTVNGNYPGSGQIYYGPFTLSTSAVVRAVSYTPDYSRSAEASPVTITVFNQPAIATQPIAQTLLVGETAVFSVAASPGPLSYQWYLNNTPILNATSATLSISNVQAASAGTYRVAVANAYGSMSSDSVFLRVLAPVMITVQPASTNVALNASVTFSVTAAGSLPLQYQWRLNGVNLAGKTNSTLTVTNAQLTDGGTYTVVILNEVGTVISNPAQLRVQVSPLQPGDNFEARVLLATASGMVSGSNTLATKQASEPNHAGRPPAKSVWYTWTAMADGVATFRTRGSAFDTVIAVYRGSTLSSLTEVAADDDTGGNLTSEVRFNATNGVEYAIAIDGVGGASGYFVLSWTNQLAAPAVTVILRHPEDTAVVRGSNATFSVTATGSGLLYHWLFNGVAISGAHNSSVIISNASLSNVGTYSVAVTNSTGQVIVSSSANLELVSQAGPVTRDKFADIGTNGSGAGLLALPDKAAAAAAAFTSVTFGIPGSQDFINTQSSSDLTDPAVCAVGGASRWLVFVPSSSGLLSFDTIGSEPSLRTIIAIFRGGSFQDLVPSRQLDCDVNGAPDGHSQVQIQADAGSAYSVLIDGTNGTKGLIHLNYCLGVVPTVSSVSTAPLVREGNFLSLSPSVSEGSPTVSYQWFHDGMLLSGATGSNYNLANASAGAGGIYSLVASNCLGQSSNVVARVVIEVPLHLTPIPSYSGGQFNFRVTGVVSRAVMIQVSTNLLKWIPIQTFNTQPYGTVNYADPAPGIQPSRFYRVMPWP